MSLWLPFVKEQIKSMVHKVIDIAWMPTPEETYVFAIKVPKSYTVSDIRGYLDFPKEIYTIGFLGKALCEDVVCQNGHRLDVVRNLLIDPKDRRRLLS